MDRQMLYDKSVAYMTKLCNEISKSSLGGEGNRKATGCFESILASLGWATRRQEFTALDWHDGGAFFRLTALILKVFARYYK